MAYRLGDSLLSERDVQEHRPCAALWLNSWAFRTRSYIATTTYVFCDTIGITLWIDSYTSGARIKMHLDSVRSSLLVEVLGAGVGQAKVSSPPRITQSVSAKRRASRHITPFGTDNSFPVSARVPMYALSKTQFSLVMRASILWAWRGTYPCYV